MAIVKSVELKEITLTGTSTSSSLSESQVDANCVVFITYNCDGAYGTTNNFNRQFTRGYVSSGSLHVERGLGGLGTINVKAYVVEFYPSQVKVQSGTTTLTASTSDTATITTVDRTKAALFFNYYVTSGEGVYARFALTRGIFTADDEIEFRRSYASGDVVISWFIIEDLGNNFTVESYTDSCYYVSYLDTIRDLEINSRRSILFSSYYVSSSSYALCDTFWRSHSYRDYIIRSDAVRSRSGDYHYYSYFVLTFTDGKRHSNFIPFTMTAGNTTTIEDVDFNIDGNKSVIINTMCCSASRSDYTSSNARYSVDMFFSAVFVDSYSKVQFDRYYYSSGTTVHAMFQVVDFDGVDFDDNTTDPRVDDFDSFVKSVEYLTESSSSESATTYLTKGQDTDNCVPFTSCKVDYNGYAYISNVLIDASLSSADNSCSFYRTSTTGDMDCGAYIVEFNTDYIKVQRGFFNIEHLDYDTVVNIEEVDLSKTFLYFTYEFSGSYYMNDAMIRGRLTSSSGITFNRADEDYIAYGHWYVVESLDDTFTVQTIDTLLATATDYYSYDTLSTAVSPQKTMLISSLTNNYNDDYAQRVFVWQELFDQSTVYSYRFDYTSSSYIHTYVITFRDDLDVYVQRYGPTPGYTFTGTEYIKQDDILMSINPSSTIANIPHISSFTATHNSNGQPSEGMIKLTISGTNLIRIERNQYSNSNVRATWEVIQFPPMPSYEFTGYVKNGDEYLDRIVRAYRRDDYELMDETVSSGTSGYKIHTTYSGSHYLVCLDDEEGEEYNALVLDKKYPQLIQ